MHLILRDRRTNRLAGGPDTLVRLRLLKILHRKWRSRLDSNQQPTASKAVALPLSYESLRYWYEAEESNLSTSFPRFFVEALEAPCGDASHGMSAPGRIRTCTGSILSRLPLLLGYEGKRRWFPCEVTLLVLRLKRPLHHFNASRDLESGVSRQELHLILLLRREVCHLIHHENLEKLAAHAGYAPAPSVRQTHVLLLHQWTKMVAARELHPALRLFKPVLSYVS